MQANRAAIGAQQYIDGSLRNAEVIEAMGVLGTFTAAGWTQEATFSITGPGLRLKAVPFRLAANLQTVMGSGCLGLGAGWCCKTPAGGAGMMIVASVLGGRMLAPVVLAVSQWRAVVNVRDAWRRLDGCTTAVPEPAEVCPCRTRVCCFQV